MQEVWGAIKDGADAYLRKQLRSILAVDRDPDCGTVLVCLYCAALRLRHSSASVPAHQSRSASSSGVARAIAFVMGALFSLTVGQIACGWPSKAMSGWPRPPGGLSAIPSASPTALAP